MIKKTILLMVILLDSICAAKTIYVNDFGAVADGKTDSTPAFKKAFAQAGLEGRDVTIQLGKGRYVLSSIIPEEPTGTQDTSHLKGKDKEDYELYKQVNKFKVPSCIKIDKLKGITLAGMGVETEIIVSCPMAGTFELWNCSNVTMRDFCIDYDPIPFTQGTIININQDTGTFDYKIDADFPQLSEYWFNKCDSKWGVSFDDQRRFRQEGISAVFCKGWKKLGESFWQMNLNFIEQAKGLRIGDRYIHIARTHNPAIGFYQCSNVHLENLNIYASPSGSTIFYRCEGAIRVNGLQTKPRPGSKRIFGPNADGVHCQSLRKGPIIENCVFEGMADDAINIYTLPSVIAEIIAPNQVRVHDCQVIQKGDYLQIFRPSSGIILEEGIQVAAVDSNIVTLSKAVDGLKAGKNHIEADTIFNLSACGNSYIIRNNIIGGFRGRGILAKGHHGLIENNLIRQTSGHGMFISNDPDWPEGPIPADLIIRNNTLIGVYRDEGQKQGAAIQVSTLKLRNFAADQPAFKSLVIENNRIIDSPAYAILLQGVYGATVSNNLVQLTDNDRPIKEYLGIKLDSCKDVKIDNFTIADQWGRVDSALFLDGTPKESVSIKNINADLSKNGQMVKQK